ncbi:hypothetical protein NEDG_02234 [Nematocida displodere]|uniref:RING-type domain-containing protein n=1 Tax=Nematocida displodere TaxID=1805483 RepID=A0A177EH25_9MICR|nr:hypothetical protein NEDG_02234 [Nematocida displodere]
MKSTPIRYFSNLFTRALRCHLLCLILLCVIVGRAEEVPEPEYIVSPYTKQTIKFFERSGSDDWENRLETVEIDREIHVNRFQPRCFSIYLNKYTLETVPEELVADIRFNRLTLESDGPVNPAVVEKILCAFGTINVSWLDLADLEIDDPSSDNNGHPRATPTPKCVLNAKELWITNTPKSSIVWLGERVGLVSSGIGLRISCGTDFGNLEVLDGFNAKRISRLTLYNIDNLDSLDCKLLREGPMLYVLIIYNNTTLTPKISEQIIQNILAKEWMKLKMPVSVLGELMKPSEQPKQLTADKLTIYLAPSQTQTLPPPGMNRLNAIHLAIIFRNDNHLLTGTDLEQTLEWVSVGFEDLEVLSVLVPDAPPALKDFVRSHTFNITTIPTLTSIWVCGIECLDIPSIISGGSSIMCFSLEAWELYRSGKLGDELANTQTDLSVLSPEQQAIVMSREEMAADNDACHVCLCTADELKAISPDADICILDHSKHSVCGPCLVVMVNAGGGARSISCPNCRQEHTLPLVKNKIGRNTQGVFELTMGTPSSTLSFPRTAPDATLPAI